MGLFNDSYDVANGLRRIKKMDDAKKAQDEQAKKAAENANKSPDDKNKDGNLFV